MISKNLLTDLEPHLKEAEEVWIAVALMNDVGYSGFQEMVSITAKQNFLVGIDLPTTVSVLKTLQNKLSEQFKAGIYKLAETFHPKVYVIKKATGYVGFVGSSNLTDGGMHKNIEMNFLIKEEQFCLELINWFENLFKQSYPLTDENINSYSEKFEIISTKQDEIRKTKNEIKLKRPESIDDQLAGVDFSDRYFKKEHHLAFRTALWEDDSNSANKERALVKDRFLELHETISPQFTNYGLLHIFPNVKNHIVSMDYHFPGQTSQQLNAMWLSYGKSQEVIKSYHEIFSEGKKLSKGKNNEEDDKQSFINHARMQVRIELKEIGIWILFGKNNGGSEFDRAYFKQKMNEVNYRNDFYTQLQKLPSEYWIRVANKKSFIKEFQNENELHDFCKKDHSRYYFIIGRDYGISDSEMSEVNLPSTVLSEFQRLYPIYDMMKDKKFINL